MNYRYYLYSLAIHSLIVLAALFNYTQEKHKGEGNSQTEQEQAQSAKSSAAEMQIVEISVLATPGKKKEVPKNFFYGIGVSIYKVNYNGRDAYGITDVYSGYPAQATGLTNQDLILALDGRPVNAENDIASDKPRTITLTIKRGDLIFDMAIVTEKIYFSN